MKRSNKKSFFLNFIKFTFTLFVAGIASYGLYLFFTNQNIISNLNSIFNFIKSINHNNEDGQVKNEAEVNNNQTDNTPLQIYNLNKLERSIETSFPVYSMVIESNKYLKLKDDTTFKNLILSVDGPEVKYYVLEILNIGSGLSNRTISIGDDFETFTFVLNINKKDIGTSSIVQSNLDWPNYKYYPSPNDLLAIVDKEYKIPTEYVPNDLVNLYEAPYLFYTNNAQMYLRKEAADALKTMLSDYKRVTGKNLVIASAYRSIENQLQLFNYWVSQLGIEEASRISAKPGYSEHHLGTVVDFVNNDSGLELTEKFADTDAYNWLTQNAHKYGFVLSYPHNKENITGYKFEPWHWRYIGIENALKFKDSNLTLNQWLKQNQ